MTIDTQTEFSIAEKEELVAEAREKYARLRREAAFADIEKNEAIKRSEEAWEAAGRARDEYNLLDQTLIEQMSAL